MKETLEGREILVVEDEMMVLMTIQSALTDVGCKATCVGTVASALHLLDGARFDAAMLDVNLHGEKSYLVADALKARGIPFIFSTGYGDHGERSAYSDRAVLRKPYLERDLIAALKALMSPNGSSARPMLT